MEEKEYIKQYRSRNKQKLAKQQKEYEIKNKDKISEYKKIYWIENKGRIKRRLFLKKDSTNEYMKEYRIKNKDKIKKYQQRRREEKKSYIKEYMREYYKGNIENIKKSTKEYRKTEKGKLVSKNYTHRRRQKIKYTDDNTITLDFIKRLIVLQRGECRGCKEKLIKKGKDNYQIDHIAPLSKGGLHTALNIQLLCSKCNSIKGCKTIDDMFFKV